jgi:hypothetical protein
MVLIHDKHTQIIFASFSLHTLPHVLLILWTIFNVTVLVMLWPKLAVSAILWHDPFIEKNHADKVWLTDSRTFNTVHRLC